MDHVLYDRLHDRSSQGVRYVLYTNQAWLEEHPLRTFFLIQRLCIFRGKNYSFLGFVPCDKIITFAHPLWLYYLPLQITPKSWNWG